MAILRPQNRFFFSFSGEGSNLRGVPYKYAPKSLWPEIQWRETSPTQEGIPWINTMTVAKLPLIPMKGVVIYSSPITICCFDLANTTVHKRANSSRVRKYSWKETFRCWCTCGELSEISRWLKKKQLWGPETCIPLKSNMDTGENH